MAERNEAQGKEQSKPSGNKTVLLAIAALVLALGVGAAGYFLGSSTGSAAPLADTPQVVQPPSAAAPLEAKKAGTVGPMVDIESFIVNILDQQGTRYLKASITLELDRKEAVAEVGERLPQVKDAILLLVGNKTFGEVSDLQGKLQLRAELQHRLNGILQQGQVKNIYFTDFVVQ